MTSAFRLKFSVMFIHNFYLQVSLGLKQLQFLIAILVNGTLASLALCSIEKVFHYGFKRKNTVNIIKVKEYPNQEDNDERRMILQHFQNIGNHSPEEQIHELNLINQEMQIFLDKQTSVLAVCVQ